VVTQNDVARADAHIVQPSLCKRVTFLFAANVLSFFSARSAYLFDAAAAGSAGSIEKKGKLLQ
jgi:hypothetical protein